MGVFVRYVTILAAMLLLAVAAAQPAAGAMGDPDVAALQVGLQQRGLYEGTIDGVPGSATGQAVRSLQQQAGVAVDGMAGPKTVRALGRYARHRLGRRAMHFGHRGWDVAALQFLLAWHGFPSARIDGHFGPRVETAVRRYQRWAGLAVDGIAGAATVESLRSKPAALRVELSWPVASPVTDRFGPRGDRFHTGLDFPARSGAPVRAARAGRVVLAGATAGGYGYLVKLAHGRGVVSWYAHLSRVDVVAGQWVERGARVGLVGSTGHSTGPHLHFEVRLRGAAVDPLPALG
jgi:peptidoglycan hydrolase-like protein with peptidoglycan-binding domain